MSKIISLSKRRGFIFPSSEIYGGLGGFYDYGPLGVELKNNIKKSWWKTIVQKRAEVVGLDAAIIMNVKTWEASGHTKGFTDMLSECKQCHKRFRLDEISQCKVNKNEIFSRCPECQSELTLPRQFNLMLKTFIGPVGETSSQTYLRPETAQGIFVNYKNILDSQRLKLPFGIAQIGKAFRNEITPGNFIFRTREFEQMELEYFIKPGEDERIFDYWVNERMRWYVENLGLTKERLRIRFHKKDELAHYANCCADIEYYFPFGWSELEGIASRTDFDLTQHQKFSKIDLRYFDQQNNEYYIPYVIEPSCGVERIALAVICDGFEEIKGGRTKTTKATKEIEVVLKLHWDLAPIKVAILPLLKNKPGLTEKAKEIYELLTPYFTCQYDEIGSIGRRYRRQDEIATPFCLTCDFQTMEDDTVTLRDRDTMKQERIKIKELLLRLKNLFCFGD